MALIRPKELIEKISKTLNRKGKLVQNLKRTIDIATVYTHNNVKDWVERELNGFDSNDQVPTYSNVFLFAHKERTILTKERSYRDKDILRNPIVEIIKTSKKASTIRNTTNMWGTVVTQYIPKKSFLGIINNVKAKIREYISKVNLDPNSAEIELDFIKDDVYKKYKLELSKELFAISSGCFSHFLQNDKEIRIFRKILEDLYYFGYKKDYKYVMISMGAIIEFLLIKHCKLNDLIPSGKSTFYNYLQLSIKKNIFGEKKSWEFINTHLRDFRNYVHIQKEIESPEIDEKWYKSLKLIFNVLYEKFKK